MTADHILVTGGAGFIGSHLVDALLAQPDRRVTVLDRLSTGGARANLEQHDDDPRLTFVLGDVNDVDLVREVVGGVDAVVHAAAESHVDRSIDEARGFLQTNLMGTQAVLEAVRTAGIRMLMISTDEVYGEGLADGGLFDEDAPVAPRSPYALSKAAADLLCHVYRTTYGVDVTVVRGTNAYGPRQIERVVPTYTICALEGLPVPVYGAGEQRREFLHVQDWARAALTVLERGAPGVLYNIGGGHRAVEPRARRADRRAGRRLRRPDRLRTGPPRPRLPLRRDGDPPARARLGPGDRVRRRACRHRRVVSNAPRVALRGARRRHRDGAEAPAGGRVRIVLTGAGGGLGRAFLGCVPSHHDVVPLTRADLDVGDHDAVMQTIPPLSPDLVLNAAAFTAVDANESDPARAFRDNAQGPHSLALAARVCGAMLLHVSTDYVFDGAKSMPYDETDEPRPLSTYGRAKLAGERLVTQSLPEAFIVRTGYVFGAGDDYLSGQLRRLRAGEVAAGLEDRIGIADVRRPSGGAAPPARADAPVRHLSPGRPRAGVVVRRAAAAADARRSAGRGQGPAGRRPRSACAPPGAFGARERVRGEPVASDVPAAG